jgi:hypothetical protein
VPAPALLAHCQTLWTEGPEQSVRRLTEKEQEDLIDRLTPLFQVRSAAIRAAARTLHAASAPRDEALRQRQTKRALVALVAAYRREPPGEARDDLAAAVHAIGKDRDEVKWTAGPRTFAVKSPRGFAQAPMLFDGDW